MGSQRVEHLLSLHTVYKAPRKLVWRLVHQCGGGNGGGRLRKEPGSISANAIRSTYAGQPVHPQIRKQELRAPGDQQKPWPVGSVKGHGLPVPAWRPLLPGDTNIQNRSSTQASSALSSLGTEKGGVGCGVK